MYWGKKILSVIVADKQNNTNYALKTIEHLVKRYPEHYVQIFTEAFRFDDYHYAISLIDDIMLSGISYLQPWFKALLIEAQQSQASGLFLAEYAKQIYLTYEEALSNL